MYITGTNDNGSGMAALFEIANSVASSISCNDNSIIFVATDLDEVVMTFSNHTCVMS